MDHEKLFWGKLEIFKEARSGLASSKTNIEKCVHRVENSLLSG